MMNRQERISNDSPPSNFRPAAGVTDRRLSVMYRARTELLGILFRLQEVRLVACGVLTRGNLWVLKIGSKYVLFLLRMNHLLFLTLLAPLTDSYGGLFHHQFINLLMPFIAE